MCTGTCTVRAGRDDPRVEHGVHRRHGRQCRAAGAPARLCRRAWRPMRSGWSKPMRCFLAALLLVGGALGDRFGRRRVFLDRRRDLRGGIDRLRARGQCRAVDRRACAHRASVARCCAGQPRDHQRSVRRRRAGQARSARGRAAARITAALGSGVRRLGWLTMARGAGRSSSTFRWQSSCSCSRGARAGKPGSRIEAGRPRLGRRACWPRRARVRRCSR